MRLKRIGATADKPTFAHYECKPCGVGISDAVDDDQDKRTMQ
jgi:hypothetical protein